MAAHRPTPCPPAPPLFPAQMLFVRSCASKPRTASAILAVRVNTFLAFPESLGMSEGVPRGKL